MQQSAIAHESIWRFGVKVRGALRGRGLKPIDARYVSLVKIPRHETVGEDHHFGHHAAARGIGGRLGDKDLFTVVLNLDFPFPLPKEQGAVVSPLRREDLGEAIETTQRLR